MGERVRGLVIDRGNPWVNQPYPYPYPPKPLPIGQGKGLAWVRVRGITNTWG